MKRKASNLRLLCLGILFIVTGCSNYTSKGYELSCTHPTKGTYNVYENAGLNKKEYQEVKEKYESMGYTCE